MTLTLRKWLSLIKWIALSHCERLEGTCITSCYFFCFAPHPHKDKDKRTTANHCKHQEGKFDSRNPCRESQGELAQTLSHAPVCDLASLIINLLLTCCAHSRFWIGYCGVFIISLCLEIPEQFCWKKRSSHSLKVTILFLEGDSWWQRPVVGGLNPSVPILQWAFL